LAEENFGYIVCFGYSILILIHTHIPIPILDTIPVAMPLRRLLAEPDDLPRIVQLENESFADSPLTPILFPNGRSQESQDAYVKTLLQQWQDNSACRHVKVIDTDLNDKIIAFARWYLFVGDDVKFIKTDPNERQNTPGANEAAANAFFGGLLRIRIAKLGRQPHCCK
jgi:hypothetical protein